MITTIRSRIQAEVRRSRSGFTLTEVMIGATLGTIILAAVLSTYLYLGRSGANLRNYSDLEAQARTALEVFAEDVRQASNAIWYSTTFVELTVNGHRTFYIYTGGEFRRMEYAASTLVGNRVLLTGITEPTSSNPFFRAYTIAGTQITDFSTASALTAANNTTKQIQISLSASRTNKTVTTATNIVLSARFVLRNKRVTA